MLRLQANLPDTAPGQNVTMLLFGDVEVADGSKTAPSATESATALKPMQAFYFRSGVGQPACAQAPSDGILIQTPGEAKQKVVLVADEVRIELGSTVFLQAQATKELIVTTLQGSAQVTSFGRTEKSLTGMRVRVPLDGFLKASGPPSAPEPYDFAIVPALPVSSLPRTVPIPGFDSFSVGREPSYSIWHGNNLFTLNYADGTVSILDGSGKETGKLNVGCTPLAGAWGDGLLWIANTGTDQNPGRSVSLYDVPSVQSARPASDSFGFESNGPGLVLKPSAATNCLEGGSGGTLSLGNNASVKVTKVRTIQVGTEPLSLSYDASHQRMWIALYAENKIIAVDAKGTILSTIPTTTNPNTVLWDGSGLWATLVGNSQAVGNTVIAIDAESKIKGTFTVGQRPTDLAWDNASKTLYIANAGDGTVTALQANGQVIGTYPVGNQPLALAWDGSLLWVTLYGDKSVVAMNKKGEILARLPLDKAPNGIIFDGANVWVALQGTNREPGSSVTRINVTRVSAFASKR